MLISQRLYRIGNNWGHNDVPITIITADALVLNNAYWSKPDLFRLLLKSDYSYLVKGDCLCWERWQTRNTHITMFANCIIIVIIFAVLRVSCCTHSYIHVSCCLGRSALKFTAATPLKWLTVFVCQTVFCSECLLLCTHSNKQHIIIFFYMFIQRVMTYLF